MFPKRRGILAALLASPVVLLGETAKESATLDLPEGFKLEIRYLGKTITLTGSEIMKALERPQFEKKPTFADYY
jgi:hypothetical protein